MLSIIYKVEETRTYYTRSTALDCHFLPSLSVEFSDRIIPYVIEREITNQVVTYLESNNLLTRDQSAYRAQHNTQTALHQVVDDWLYNITDGFHTSVCSFDILKCFDTINHSILCKTMEKYGFHEDDIDLFR